MSSSRIDPFQKNLNALPDRFLLGVSGGVDSCALLHALIAAKKKPIIVHFDHRWRRESAADALFVRSLARYYEVPFYLGKNKVPASKTEAVARKERWLFFKKVAVKTKSPVLVLAHHADDQVETFLLQLLRGTGSGSGMSAKIIFEGIEVYRPWLHLWRKEILAYAKRENLQWREDRSNRDLSYKRNRVRHRLLPYLIKNFSATAPQLLWRAAEIKGAENEWLEQLSRLESETEKLQVKKLVKMPLAQQRKVIYLWLQRNKVKNINFKDIENVKTLIEQRFPAKVNLSKNRFVRRQKGALFLE